MRWMNEPAKPGLFDETAAWFDKIDRAADVILEEEARRAKERERKDKAEDK